MRAELAEYLKAVLRHTYLLLIGAFGAILSVVGIVVPAFIQIVGIVLLGFGLFGAQFMAWREMRGYREKVVAEYKEDEQRWNERNVGLQNQLDLRYKRKDIREKLGEFFAEGEKVREWIERGGEAIGDVSSFDDVVYFGSKPREAEDSSLAGSISQSAVWDTKVASYLSENLGDSYVALFRSAIGTSERVAPKLGSKEHVEAWHLVDRRLQKLVEIIREVGEDLVGT